MVVKKDWVTLAGIGLVGLLMVEGVSGRIKRVTESTLEESYNILETKKTSYKVTFDDGRKRLIEVLNPSTASLPEMWYQEAPKMGDRYFIGGMIGSMWKLP